MRKWQSAIPRRSARCCLSGSRVGLGRSACARPATATAAWRRLQLPQLHARHCAERGAGVLLQPNNVLRVRCDGLGTVGVLRFPEAIRTPVVPLTRDARDQERGRPVPGARRRGGPSARWTVPVVRGEGQSVGLGAWRPLACAVTKGAASRAPLWCRSRSRRRRRRP